jgi:hypothetical protein
MTSSCHRCLGLPTGLVPIGFQSSSFLVGLAWFILWICPSRLILSTLMHLTISASSVHSSISTIFRILPIRPRWKEVAVPGLWPTPEVAVTVFDTPDDGCCDTRNMLSDFAVNKCLHTAASSWTFLLTLTSSCYNHHADIHPHPVCNLSTAGISPTSYKLNLCARRRFFSRTDFLPVKSLTQNKDDERRTGRRDTKKLEN